MSDARKTIIQPKVLADTEEIYNYIKLNSPQNAQKFKSEILKQIDQVEKNPESYPGENYLNTVIILYRFALVMKSWKLIFKVTKTVLTFIGIVHTSQHTNEIKKLRKD